LNTFEHFAADIIFLLYPNLLRGRDLAADSPAGAFVRALKANFTELPLRPLLSHDIRDGPAAHITQ
jgi:hypothetical protein